MFEQREQNLERLVTETRFGATVFAQFAGAAVQLEDSETENALVAACFSHPESLQGERILGDKMPQIAEFVQAREGLSALSSDPFRVLRGKSALAASGPVRSPNRWRCWLRFCCLRLASAPVRPDRTARMGVLVAVVAASHTSRLYHEGRLRTTV